MHYISSSNLHSEVIYFHLHVKKKKKKYGKMQKKQIKSHNC